MMLKFIGDFDILEEIYDFSDCELCYNKTEKYGEGYDSVYLNVDTDTREISLHCHTQSIPTINVESFDTIFDLIKAGLVEKV